MLKVDCTLMAKAFAQSFFLCTHTHSHKYRDISNYLMAILHAVLLCKCATAAAASVVAPPLFPKYLRLLWQLHALNFLNATANRNFPIIITHTHTRNLHTLRVCVAHLAGHVMAAVSFVQWYVWEANKRRKRSETKGVKN